MRVIKRQIHQFGVWLLLISSSLLTEFSYAASEKTTVPTIGNSVLSVVTTLFFVIAIILLCAWLLKRINSNRFAAGKDIEVLVSKAIGAKERLVIIKVAEQNILLGVTAHTIQKIQKLPDSYLPGSTCLRNVHTSDSQVEGSQVESSQTKTSPFESSQAQSSSNIARQATRSEESFQQAFAQQLSKIFKND